MEIYTPPQPARAVPIISFADMQSKSGRAEIARQIHRACRETGFFYVLDHGVPEPLVADQFYWSAKFFDLPPEQKQALGMDNSPTRAGYSGIGTQTSDSQNDDVPIAPPDLKESFYIGVETDPAHRLHEKYNGLGGNLWPDLPGFKPQMLAYHKALCGLGERVMAMLALSLDMPQRWFEPHYADPTAILRLMKYPPHPQDALENQLGAGAHTDWGGITLLAQDDAGGLEVRSSDGVWITAPPIKGTFVVNLGDLMARWTNGLYASTLHRVKNSESTRERYSVPFFYNPTPDAIIAPIPTCISADRSRLYPDCTTAEHMTEMFRRSYGYDPTSSAAS